MGSELQRPLREPPVFMGPAVDNLYNRYLCHIYEFILEGSQDEKFEVVQEIVEKNESIQEFLENEGLDQYLTEDCFNTFQ